MNGNYVSDDLYSQIVGMLSDREYAHKEARKKLFNDLEELQTQGVPIFNISYRVKKAKSLYLKAIKRDKCTKEDIAREIDDIVGMRILCGFEQDLSAVFESILKHFVESRERNHDDYDLRSIECYGWHESISDKFEDSYNRINNKQASGVRWQEEPAFSSKKSGYKSIHLTVTVIVNTTKNDPSRKCPVKIELQLSTLIQNSWSSIEHWLAYKNRNENPYIRESMKLLTQHLAYAEDVMRYMRDLASKDDQTQQLYRGFYRPLWFLHYDDASLPTSFREETYKTILNRYDLVKSRYDANFVDHELKKWLQEIGEWYSAINKLIIGNRSAQ